MRKNEIGVQESIPERGSSPCKGPGVEGEGYSWNAESEDELALRCSQRSRQTKSHAEPCPIISQKLQSQDLNLGLRSTH